MIKAWLNKKFDVPKAGETWIVWGAIQKTDNGQPLFRLNTDGYPEFDWDRVPLYAHLSAGSKTGPWVKMFGAEQAAAMDDGMIAMVKQARENITFPLTCFLVGAERHCHFCYTWGWLGEYGTFD